MKPELAVNAAREVADWLDRQPGCKFRAEAVRRVCRSHSALRSQMSVQNQQLRRALAESTPLARERKRANAGVEPLVIELRQCADQLDRMRKAAAFGGDDVSVRVTDAPYLIDLLRRTEELLR